MIKRRILHPSDLPTLQLLERLYSGRSHQSGLPEDRIIHAALEDLAIREKKARAMGAASRQNRPRSTDPNVTRILNQVEIMEKQYNVKVIYLCESGSRLWGFDSADSDYDVRGVCISPVESYLSVENPPASDIHFMSEDKAIDIAVWDIRKFLDHIKDNKISALEWLRADIVYQDNAAFKKDVNAAFAPVARARLWYSAYGGWGRSSMAEMVTDEPGVVKIKKYLYAIRLALSAQYSFDFESLPPLNINTLVDAPNARLGLDEELKEEIRKVLATKKSGKEADTIASHPIVLEYLKKWLRDTNGDWDSLIGIRPEDGPSFNAVFRKHIGFYDELEDATR